MNGVKNSDIEWTVEDMLAVFQADGLLPAKDIAKLIPRRSSHAVNSFSKRFPGRAPGAFNGLPYDLVERYDPSCPYLWTEAAGGTRLCLWVDIHARAQRFPEGVRSAIAIMAQFQQWLYNSNERDLRGKICKVLTSCQPDRRPTKTSRSK